MSSVALDGPTFVDDDTVLLCADSPSQLIDKICEATRIYVETARKFGLTLNFDKGKTETLVSWGRKERSQVLAHEAVIHQKWYSLFKDSGTGATSTPRLGVQTCWYMGLQCCLSPP